ncbi:MAG: hypothetical protein HF967_04895 [Methanosarcinales archaeon]|nr:hypothetical protein [Methanosarcinales archaeon]
MDEKKINALKKIQEFRDKKNSPDFESLEKEGFDKSTLRVMENEGLIRFAGVFSITEKGEQILRDYLVIDSTKKDDKLRIILDSNLFDDIVTGNLKIDENIKKKAEFYITHIQVDEINKCSDEEKRAKLFLFMGKASPVIIPTASFILGKSRLGEARLGDGIIFEELKKGNIKHTEDALIGETAIKDNLILVTQDVTLKNKVNSQGGKAIDLLEFKELLE